MIAGTDFVLNNEPCVNLSERDLMGPEGQWHRYEILLIIRNWMPYEYRRDMGLALKWKGIDPIRVMGGVLDGDILEAYETVDSMREIALEMRARPAFSLSEILERELTPK